jgi:exonuclease III
VQETRNNNDSIKQALGATHTVFFYPGSGTNPGHGMMVAIKNEWSDACLYKGHSSQAPLMWVQVPGCFIGFIYVPQHIADDSKSTPEDKAHFMAALQADVMERQSRMPVVLMGDWNAHVGDLPDASDMPRKAHFHKITNWGRTVMEMARHCDLVASTGRMDEGEASRVQSQQRSRIDHIFLQSDLWHRGHMIGAVGPSRLHSDHHPLLLSVDVTQGNNTIIQLEPRQAPYLRWNPGKANQYAQHIQAQTELKNQFQQALEGGQLGAASMLMTSMIWAAAASKEVGMVVDPFGQRKRSYTALRMNNKSARIVKAHIRYLRQTGQDIPEELRQQWRKLVKQARATRKRSTHYKLRQYISSRPAHFWKIYSGSRTPSNAVVSIDTWASYYQRKFTLMGATSLPEDSQPDDVSGCTTSSIEMELMAEVTQEEVMAAFRRLGKGKARGVDGIPAEFVTGAQQVVQEGSTQHMEHVLVQEVTQMMSLAISQGDIPNEWKIKCIHPIYKRGGKHLPENYRPVAVSNTYYRILTAILGRRIIEVTIPGESSMMDRLFAPHQLAFRPQLGVQHAHLALQTCCDIAKAEGFTLVIVKLDIEKAYDTVDRPKLWNAMCRAGLPWKFVAFVRNLYKEAGYVIRANGRASTPFTSSIGLQQGCALSPVLYNVYLREALQFIQQACADIGVPMPERPCTSVNYADDIKGTIVGTHNVQRFLDTVDHALLPLNQRINRDKCEALVVNKSPRYKLPDTLAGVPVVKEMKALGLMFNGNGDMGRNVKVRIQAAQRSNIHIFSRFKELGVEIGASNYKIFFRLLEAQVRPILLFGDGIWGHVKFSSGNDPMSHPMQPVFSVLMRAGLGLASSTAHWISSMIGGFLPVQAYICMDFCRFWNNLLSVAQYNALVQSCLQAQLHMCVVQGARHTWLRQWCDAFDNLQLATDITPILLAQDTIPVKQVKGDLTSKYTEILQGFGDPFQPDCQHRRMAMHFRVFNLAPNWGKRPAHLSWRIPGPVRRTWMQFLAAQSKVPARSVELISSQIAWQFRTCSRCTQQVVGDEQHVLLNCPDTHQCRVQFAHRVDLSGRDLRGVLLDNKHNPQLAWLVWQIFGGGTNRGVPRGG